MVARMYMHNIGGIGNGGGRLNVVYYLVNCDIFTATYLS